jgi:outer membrane protein assembly factor BamB
MDDWLTFGHDYMRTGFQAQNTGISKKTVGGLEVRWKRNTGQNMVNAPLVYGGNVIAASSWFNQNMPGIVYDYAAKDGRLLWKRPVDGEIRATPSIDPGTNMVFVSTRHPGSSLAQALPGTLYALDLTNGAVKWTTKIPGFTRGAAVVANNHVYIGASGGDAPYCLNGGVSAYNETTGKRDWVWHVNEQTKILGTGNTCTSPVTTANGAVELNMKGKVLWSFVAVANSGYDEDTGGGVTVSNGQAIFINKNGSAYSLGSSNGQESWTKFLGAAPGDGGFATPSTDGSTILVGDGLQPDSASEKRAADGAEPFCPIALDPRGRVNPHADPHTSYHSSLVAFDTHGSVLWKVASPTVIEGYAAIVDGVAFIGLGNNFEALDVRTGKTLWSYAAANVIISSVAVVPSGVYAADFSGNVYAFSLPK